MQTENTYVETDLGNIALNPRGEYSDEASYEYLDTVSYKGGSYICVAELGKSISGIAPAQGKNTEHWQMLTLPGQLTPEAAAMHDDVVNKAKQVETSRAAVELSQQEVEAAQADVSQMRQDTQDASQMAIASRDSAAGYAQSAEISRTAAKESEDNVNALTTTFDSHVYKKISEAESTINTAKQSAVDAVSDKQKTSITEIENKVNKQVKSVEDAGVSQVSAVNKAGSTQVSALETKGADQVKAIQEAGKNALQNISNGVDKGLSEEGKAADAKATGEAISNLTKDLSNKITKFYASNQGETHIADSDNGKIVDMMIYGKSSQDGTPSLENPVEIKSVVNPAIKICGKNLFDSKKFPIILNRAIDTNTGVMYESLNGNYCAIEKYIPFPYSGKKISFNASMSLCAYDKDYKFISSVNKNNGQVPSGTMYVRFDIKIEDKDKAQIELSENTTTYEPYKEQTIQLPITLNAIPVSSGGNVTIGGQQYVADYVDIEKGKLYRKVKRLNLKDADDIRIAHGFHSNGNGYLSFSAVDDVNKEQQPISNRYKGSKWTSESGYVYIPNNNSIVFVDARFTDKQTTIKLIQDTYVIYALSSQTEEDLSLEQIKSLKSLSTYYPVTNITVDSEELDGYAVFNYSVSMANGWNYVKQQLNDNRDYIYDMDLQSAEAYVNSEYAVALTELEV